MAKHDAAPDTLRPRIRAPGRLPTGRARRFPAEGLAAGNRKSTPRYGPRRAQNTRIRSWCCSQIVESHVFWANIKDNFTMKGLFFWSRQLRRYFPKVFLNFIRKKIFFPFNKDDDDDNDDDLFILRYDNAGRDWRESKVNKSFYLSLLWLGKGPWKRTWRLPQIPTEGKGCRWMPGGALSSGGYQVWRPPRSSSLTGNSAPGSSRGTPLRSSGIARTQPFRTCRTRKTIGPVLAVGRSFPEEVTHGEEVDARENTMEGRGTSHYFFRSRKPDRFCISRY